MPVALVTGLGGFTGRHLAKRLVAAGYLVQGLEARSGGDSGFETHTCDLNDRDAMIALIDRVQPDVVVHLAAISFVAHGDAAEIYRTNVVGTRNLLEGLAALRRAPRAVLLASSANIYGNTTVDPITEDVQPQPANDYAVSKLAMEHMARIWMDRLPITMVRPFNYTGVNHSRNFLIPKIVDHFKRRASLIELGNLEIARDFSDVRAVVECYARLLEAGAAGQVFNVCSGRAYTLQDVLELMERIAGYPIEVRVNPAFIRANDVKTLRGSQDRLSRVIGAVQVPDLESTLRWMYESAE